MIPKEHLCRLAVLLIAIPSLHAQQVMPTVSPPPKIVRYVAPLFGLSANPCLPMSVRLGVTIGAGGEVSDVRIVSGPPGLQKAASEAVRLWLFEPSIVEGRPAQVVTEVEVPNAPAESKCQLPTPTDSFSFPYAGVEGVGVRLGSSVYGCRGCWFLKSEGGVGGGPLDGGPGMIFRLRSDANELEFKCRAHECRVRSTFPSETPSYSQTLKFDEDGVIPTSARVTFTVTK
jgi:TonB family protein